jgi:hypothetical protein
MADALTAAVYTSSVDELVSEFPEFARCPAALIAAKLADAERLTAVDYEPITRPVRVKYLACELLALSPAAEFARLDPSKERDGACSLYERRRLEIDRANSFPIVVL